MQFLPQWGKFDFSEIELPSPGKTLIESRAFSVDDDRRINDQFNALVKAWSQGMINVEVPSDTKGIYYLKGSVITDKNAKYIREHLNSVSVTLQKDGTVRVMDKIVPKHQVKWLRDPRSNQITFNRAALWYVNRELDEQMLAYMNGAHVTMPRFNKNHLTNLITIARAVIKHEAMHWEAWVSYAKQINSFKPFI